MNAQKVREIRQRRVLGDPLNRIAEDFGISFQHVSDIVRRKRWAHLED